jgi:hypothetical protein
MANRNRLRAAASLITVGCLAVGLTGCSSLGVVRGSPTAPPAYGGTIDVELAFTDSFDVLPDGKCEGREGDVVATTASVGYERDTGRRRGVYDDGQYCVAKFTFTPPRPNLTGYVVWFPPRGYVNAHGFDYGWSLSFIPTEEGTYTVVGQTCADHDAPPERTCGFG